MRQSLLLLLSIAVLAIAGCADARTDPVVADDAQVVYNLAGALPLLPPERIPAAAAALQELAKQIGIAIGHPVDTTQGNHAPAATPSKP